jgi:hypothetical protein
VPLVASNSLNLHLVPLSSSKILVMPVEGSEHICGRQRRGLTRWRSSALRGIRGPKLRGGPCLRTGMLVRCSLERKDHGTERGWGWTPAAREGSGIRVEIQWRGPR